MRNFFYKARKNGATLSGIIEAKGEAEAAKLLREQGLFIIKISPQKTTLALLSFFTNRVSLSDVVGFTRQLSSMITAGLTITESLAVLINQTEKSSIRQVLEEILTDIEGGSSFSSALTHHKEVFRPVYIAMIKAAEEAGLLDKVLSRLADNLEKEREFRREIISALIYPIIIILGMVAVAFIVMVFVIPTISSLYKELELTLPLPTRVVFFISTTFANYWFLILGLIALGFFALSNYRKSDAGARQLDILAYRLPILGRLRRLIILTEMTRTLGLLVGAGTPIIPSINITADATGSLFYKDSLINLAKKVEKGVRVGEALASDPRFPQVLVQMGKVGETTGKLDDALLRVSGYFETEAGQMIKTLTKTLEPLIMVILGIGVAFLILAVIVPIYNLTTAF